AAFGVNEGPLEFELLAPAIDDIDVPGEDCLRADGADLLADDAVGIHRPGEATPLVVERRAGLDRPLRLERADAELLGDRDLADRARRADLRAEGAVQLAPAHLRDHDRGPEPLEPRLEHRRLEH